MEYIINNWWQLLLMTPLMMIVIAGFFYYLFVMVRAEPILVIPIIVIVLAMIGSFNIAKASTFEYKGGLKLEAPNYKAAAKLCFKRLNPVFVTEEKALDVIDVCANPVKGSVK